VAVLVVAQLQQAVTEAPVAPVAVPHGVAKQAVRVPQDRATMAAMGLPVRAVRAQVLDLALAVAAVRDLQVRPELQLNRVMVVPAH
jgi:hypothetical protein